MLTGRRKKITQKDLKLKKIIKIIRVKIKIKIN